MTLDKTAAGIRRPTLSLRSKRRSATEFCRSSNGAEFDVTVLAPPRSAFYEDQGLALSAALRPAAHLHAARTAPPQAHAASASAWPLIRSSESA